MRRAFVDCFQLSFLVRLRRLPASGRTPQRSDSGDPEEVSLWHFAVRAVHKLQTA